MVVGGHPPWLTPNAQMHVEGQRGTNYSTFLGAVQFIGATVNTRVMHAWLDMVQA